MELLFRLAILALGYFYPAYKCFKDIDLGKPKSEHLHVWCHYWIIMAIYTGFERVADTFISWLPFYSGAKLAFVVYLWHPDTKGTEYIYQTVVKPYLSERTESVDLNLVLARDEAARVLTILCNRLMYYVRFKVSDVLQQNAAPLPDSASKLTQGGLHLYPSISSSFCEGKVQQQPWSLPRSDTPPLVTQSAIWPREQYQWHLPKASTYPLRTGGDLPPSLSHVQPTQPPRQHKLPSYPVAKAPNLGLATKSSTLLDPNNEETDFELVHSNEVPKPGAPNSNTGAQAAARSRWSWWR